MTENQSLFDDPPPDLRQQIEELKRELKMRRQVYPRLIDKGTLTTAQASYQIRCVEASIDSLLKLATYGHGGGDDA